MSIKSQIAEFLKLDELKENFLKLIEAKFELKKLEIQEKALPKAADAIFIALKIMASLLAYIFFWILVIVLFGVYFNLHVISAALVFGLHLIILIFIIFNADKFKVIIKTALEKLL